jgi:exodeoxyribonuclease VII large subunit
LETRLRRFDMQPRLANGRRRLETFTAMAAQCIRMMLTRRRGRLDQLAAKLSQLSPLRILERGYAIVSNEAGVVKDSASAPADSRIHVRLAKGELDALVK